MKNLNKGVVIYNYSNKLFLVGVSALEIFNVTKLKSLVCLFTVILQLTINQYYNYVRLKSIGFFYEKKEVDLYYDTN